MIISLEYICATFGVLLFCRDAQPGRLMVRKKTPRLGVSTFVMWLLCNKDRNQIIKIFAAFYGSLYCLIVSGN